MAQRHCYCRATAGGSEYDFGNEPTKGLDVLPDGMAFVQYVQLFGQIWGFMTITHDVVVARQLGVIAR